MGTKVGAFGKHSLVYALGSAVTAAAGFILIPLYTKVLSVSQFGVLELANRTVEVLSLVAFVGVRQSLIRYFFDARDDDTRKIVVSSTYILVGGVVAFIVAGSIIFAKQLSFAVFGTDESQKLIYLLLAWLPLEMFFGLGLTYYQIILSSKTFVVYSVGRLISAVALNIIFVVVFKLGVEGVVLANIVVSGILAFSMVIRILKSIGCRVRKSIIRDLLSFGAPFLPTAVLMYLISNSGRFALVHGQGLEQVGIFSLAFKLGGMGAMLVMEPINKVWGPFLFSNCNTEAGIREINRVFAAYVLVAFSVAVGVVIFGPTVIEIISTDEYFGAKDILPMIGAASALLSMAHVSDAGILVSKKTVYKPIIFLIAAVVGIPTTILFTRLWGVIGCSMGMLISYGLLFVVNLWFSKKFFPLKLSFGYFSAVILVFGFVSFLSHQINAFTDGTINFLSKCLLAMVYLYFAWVVFLDRGFRKAIMNYLGRGISRFCRVQENGGEV